MFNLPVKYWHYGRNKSGNGNVLTQDPDEVFPPINIPCESHVSFTIKNLFQLVPQLTLDNFIASSNEFDSVKIEYKAYPVSASGGWAPGTVGPLGYYNSEIYNARNGDVVKFTKKDNDLKVHLLQNKCVVASQHIVYQIEFLVYLIDSSHVNILHDKSYTVYNPKGNYYIENMSAINAGRFIVNQNPIKYIYYINFQNYGQNIVKSTGDNLTLDDTVDANWVIEII